jgi:beta-ureidopropionase
MKKILLLIFTFIGFIFCNVYSQSEDSIIKSQLSWEKVKVAAVQLMIPTGGDPSDIVVTYINRAAADKVQLVVFPEYHLGYVNTEDERVKKVSAAAKENNIYVIVGCFETYADGSYSNVALLFGRDGTIIGRHKKVHPAVGVDPYYWPPNENDVEWKMELGETFDVFDLDFGRIGILTCFDGYFPESFEMMSLKGAEILVWINGRPYVEEYIVKSVMFLNYVDMICTNDCYGTMIAEYPTTIKKYCSVPQESYITDELDLKKLRIFRKNSRFFHQRRPEVYEDITKEWRVWDRYKNLTE